MTVLEWVLLAVVVLFGCVNIWLCARAELAFRLFMAQVNSMDETVKVAIDIAEAAGARLPKAAFNQAEQARKGP